LESRYSPADEDAFLVAPADMPKLSSAIVRKLIGEHRREPGRILVPTLAGRRGHPVLFPWRMAALAHNLGADEGLNALFDRNRFEAVACDHLIRENEQPFGDLDTPEQYQRLASEYEGGVEGS
jgi:molybdenum cofactor cytidylyltransferase